VRLDSAFDRYLGEFAQPPSSGLVPQGAAAPAGVEGRIVREDRLAGAGPALVQTRDDTAGRLYFRPTDAVVWRELPLPRGGRVEEARWVRDGEAFRIVLVLRQPWWPLGRSYGRFWRALLQPGLRPESGLFLLDPEVAESKFLSAGRMPSPSPDRRAVAFLRSERRGLHSLHLWWAGQQRPVTVVSLWEADPGSGPSFHWNWSSDSKVLFVRGTARGFEDGPATSPSAVRLLYDVEGDRLVELLTD